MKNITLLEYYVGLVSQCLITKDDINNKGFDDLIAKRSLEISLKLIEYVRTTNQNEAKTSRMYLHDKT